MAHTHANPRKKRQEFWIAFAGWFVINLAAVYVIQVVSYSISTGSGGTAMGVLTAFQFLLNLAAVIVLALNRSYAALGVGAAVATSLWVAVLEGVFYVISLFAGGYTYYWRGYPPNGSIEVTYAFLIAALIVAAVAASPVLWIIHRQIR